MIQITRLLAKQVRTVFKKALGNMVRGFCHMSAGPDGLRIQGESLDHAIEYHFPGEMAPAELTLPFQVLDDVQGARNEPVTFTLPKKNTLAVSWEDRGTARSLQYARPKAERRAFPAIPASWAQNPPVLAKVLREAMATTDSESSRYSLGCLQWQGKAGQLAATDGRHALVAAGFQFGFEEDLLVRGTKVFGCREIPQDQLILIGKTETHGVVRIGPWTIWLPIDKEGRFPRVRDIIPDPKNTHAALQLTPEDSLFLMENASRLHSSPEFHGVTIDLGSATTLRAKDAEASRPIEIVLTNSTCSGEAVRIACDERYLVRAAEMGFSQVNFHGKGAAIVARDDQRTYLWMPFGPDDVIPPSEDCLRIESPQAAAPSSPTPSVSRSTLPMHRPPVPAPAATPPAAESVTPPAPARRRKAAASATSPLDQALALRTSLREAVHRTNELIRAMKKERQHQRLLKSTLKSLKDLQAVAA